MNIKKNKAMINIKFGIEISSGGMQRKWKFLQASTKFNPSESNSNIFHNLSDGLGVLILNIVKQNTGVGSLSLLQRIFFPAQGLNPGLPHCRQILYQLSCKGSPWNR